MKNHLLTFLLRLLLKVKVYSSHTPLGVLVVEVPDDLSHEACARIAEQLRPLEIQGIVRKVLVLANGTKAKLL